MFPAKEKYKKEKWKYNYYKILRPLGIVNLFKITFLTVWIVEISLVSFRGDY